MIAALNSDTQKYLGGLDAATRTQVAKMSNENQLVINTNQQAASLFNQSMAMINDIQRTTRWMRQTKAQAISEQFATTNSALRAIGRWPA